MISVNHKLAADDASQDILSVDVARLRRQSDYHWKLPQSWLQGILDQCEYDVMGLSGACDVRFTDESGTLHLEGTVQFAVETECATCLRKLKLDLCAHIDTVMQPADTAENSQDELTPEDLEIEYFSGTSLILDELVGDSILLELPMIPRCESACRPVNGLVTAAELEEKEQTVDPRLKALANIKLSKES